MEISELKVLNNIHGWYVGRTYVDPALGTMEIAYSRDSRYFDNEEDATAYLDAPVITAIYH